MYLELSRPNGDVSRWEKVLKRLTLLNKHYPLRGKNCSEEDIQRLFQYGSKDVLDKKNNKKNKSTKKLKNEKKLKNKKRTFQKFTKQKNKRVVN